MRNQGFAHPITRQIALEALLRARANEGKGDRIIKVAPNWFIDPVHGNDSNNGFSANHALKTWSEFQDRIGIGTEIFTTTGPVANPGLITINLLNDLPETDPITWFNVLGPGSTALVQGQLKQIGGIGTLTASNPGNRVTNTRITVKDGASLNSTKLGLQMQITTGAGAGSRAYVAANRGGGTMQMTQWCTGSDPAGSAFFGIVPGPAPVAGNKYKLFDFTVAYLGICNVGYDTGTGSSVGLGGIAGIGGLAFQNIHFAFNALGPQFTYLPDAANGSTVTSFADCIFDQQTVMAQVNTGLNTMASCIIRTNLQIPTNSFCADLIFGGVVPFEGSGASINGGSLGFDGDFAFIGNNDLVPGTTADWFPGFVVTGPGATATAFSNGPTSFWASISAIDAAGPVIIFAGGNGSAFGIMDQPGWYGTDNVGPPFFEQEVTVVIISGNEFAPSAIVTLPTLASPNASAPYAGADFIMGFDTFETSTKSYAFDGATGNSAAGGGRLNTWAQLNTTIGAGGFNIGTQPNNQNPGTHLRNGIAARPDTKSSVFFEAFIP